MEAETIETRPPEETVIMSQLIEKSVDVPINFSIRNLFDNHEIDNYQSISPEVKDEYFAPKKYSGIVSLNIEPALNFIEADTHILPGLDDALATLSALHIIVRDDPGLIYVPGFRNIIIPVPSIIKLHGELIYLMISHVELFKKHLGWKLGFIFDWKNCDRVSKFHVAYLNVPF